MNNEYFNTEEKEMADKIRSLSAFKLTDEERHKAKKMLLEYARMKPVRVAAAAPRAWFSFGIRPIPVIAGVMVVILSTSTAAAAENALPGDFLYNIKVSINEPVRASLAASAEAKAAWAIERAERRIEEAASLALAGELDDETNEDLNARFETHVKEAEAEQASLQEENSVAASRIETNLRATLIAHADVLAEVREELEDEGSRARIDTVIERVSSRTFASARKAKGGEEAATMMMALDVSRESDVADEQEENAEEARSVAKERIEASERLVTKNEGRVREDTRARLQARLTGAKSTFAEAEDALSRGDRRGARARFTDALHGAIQTRAMLATEANSAPKKTAATSLSITAPSPASVTIETGETDAGAATMMSVTTQVAATTSTTTDEKDDSDEDIKVEVDIRSDEDEQESGSKKIKIDL
ncbi:hypothetical protein HY969_02200 [Candidatus Kaiserbacteria bacterium]|nr:hypothetical protein [Candidatus Kaiserbacteria bacterium]